MSADETAIQKLILKGEKPPPSPSLPPTPVDIAGLLAKIKSPVPNRPNFITGQKTVRTSGTPEQLPTLAIPDGFSLVIKAKKANTGKVTIGASQGAANNTGTDNFSLAANEAITLAIQTSSLLWIDVTVSGEGVELLVEQ